MPLMPNHADVFRDEEPKMLGRNIALPIMSHDVSGPGFTKAGKDVYLLITWYFISRSKNVGE